MIFADPLIRGHAGRLTPMTSSHPAQHGHVYERHRSGRSGWLRAAVLGADDGIVSTASLMIGVAATGATSRAVVTSGLAGLVAGALSMATGEYVSVSSQRDAEDADRAVEEHELRNYPDAELFELTQIYVGRGLDRALAEQVAAQLHQNNALEAHLRDELGLRPAGLARPLQAAAASAGSFCVGAAVPVVVGLVSTAEWVLALVALALLALLGSLGAGLGGAPRGRAALRVLVGGGLAMAATAVVGDLVGTGSVV